MAGVSARKIRVLIVDDSALVRRLVHSLLGADPEIDVVATAADLIWQTGSSE